MAAAASAAEGGRMQTYWTIRLGTAEDDEDVAQLDPVGTSAPSGGGAH